MRPIRALFPRRLLVALTMLVALGAGLLVSAGSDHHAVEHHAAGHHAAEHHAAEHHAADHHAATQPHAETAAVTVTVQPGDHEHHHGGDWTPTLSQALRPCAAATILCTLPAVAEARSVPIDFLTRDLSGSAAEHLARLGVLRV